MIVGPPLTKGAVRTHYDAGSVFYRWFWGRHIHHGLWEGEETVEAAQLRLVDRLADLAGLRQGERVLDVGSGLGETAVYLAQTRRCQVVGVTLSPLQGWWACLRSWQKNLAEQVQFLIADVERQDWPAGSFDVVWSVECTEHLFDKAGFFRRAAGWLRRGGRLAVAAWLAKPDPQPREREVLLAICRAFLCPSLGDARDYTNWLLAGGLHIVLFEDITERVSKTWDICLERLNSSRLAKVLRRLPSARLFLQHLTTIRDAEAQGLLRYGLFVASR